MATLKRRLKAEGISEREYNRFKLYNPDTFDKFTEQAYINEGVAVRDYKKLIHRGSKRQ